MQDPVEQIKQKLDIVNVIREYLELRKTGNSYKAKCPFHNEKPPSFHVSPDKQIFHCFGCGVGGDMFSFIEKIEGVEFPEALRILAQKSGVEIKRSDPRAISQKNRLYDVCAEAGGFWYKNLYSSAGFKALDYVQKRGLNQDTVQKFKIGYAPDDWQKTMHHLRSRGFSENEIFKAGLIVQKKSGSGYYDRFSDRLIFPVQDLHGNVVGFSGRALNSEETAKYINTPEGRIYHKGNILYGLDKAKTQIRKADYAIVVEGNMDVITAHQHGCDNVVACSGTALTQEQTRLLKRYSNNVALCFDQDEAGQLAAARSIDLLLAAEMNIKIIELKSGKDPDECIKNNPKDWEDSIKSAKLVMQFYFDRYLTEENLNDINKKKKAVKSVLLEITKIKNNIEQAHWLKKLSEKLDIQESLLWDSLPEQKRSGQNSSETRKTEVVLKKQEKNFEQIHFERIITILLSYPDLIGYVVDRLEPEFFNDQKMIAFYKSLIMFYNKSDNVDKAVMTNWLSRQSDYFEQSYLDSLILYIDREYEGFEPADLEKELMKLVKNLKINYLHKKLNGLNEELRSAEKENNEEAISRILKNIKAVTGRLSELK